MPLNANALVTLAEAKAELSIDTIALDAQVERYINDASDWCEHLCGRKLKARPMSYVCEGPRSPRLFADPFPIDILATITITVNGQAQTVWKQPADGDQNNFDVIVRSSVRGGELDHFWHSAGYWGCPTVGNPDNVSIAYTGGIATVPELLKDACLILVQKISRDAVQQIGSDVQAIQGAGAPGSMSFRGSPVPLEALRKLEAYMLLRVA